MSQKSRNATLFGAAILTVALWLIPGGSYLTLPLVYLNTILHEFCHAIATLVTGGNVVAIRIESNGSGTTLSMGGFGLLISSAGYIGAAVLGALMIASGKSVKSSRTAMIALAALLGIGTLLWIRNGLGIALALVWLVGVAAWAKYQRDDWLKFGIQFIGLQQGLNAIQSLWVLLQINAVSGIENDALIASRQFPMPPMAFAVTWCAISFLLMGLALRRVWSGSSNSAGG